MPFPRQGKGGIDLATYTANYGLHQWEASDNFLRTDFNTDFSLIDGALGELAEDKAEVVFGSYQGTYIGGSSGGAYSQDINLGWKPEAVLVFANNGSSSGLEDLPCQLATSASAGTDLAITDNGFTVMDELNTRAFGIYRYIALY